MRKSLVALEDAGVVEATEERHPAHFHVAVLRQNPERHIQMAAGDVAPSVAADSKPKTRAAFAQELATRRETLRSGKGTDGSEPLSRAAYSP